LKDGSSELREEFEDLKAKLEEIAERISDRKKPFSFSDFVQELTGALILAFPFAANADVWEISKNMTVTHALLVLFLTVVGLYLFIRYAEVGSWKAQNLGGFLPLRLITSLTISALVSSLAILILGIYPSIINSVGWFAKTVVLVTLFSVMGSIGLDAAK